MKKFSRFNNNITFISLLLFLQMEIASDDDIAFLKVQKFLGILIDY